MIPYSSSTGQQVGVHEDLDPGRWKDWVGAVEKSWRGGSLQMIDDGNEGWGWSQ